MKLNADFNGRLYIETQHGHERPHLIHCSESLYQIKQDSAAPYMVAEESGNFARLHLLTSWSEEEAAQEVANYLQEKEQREHPHIIAVFKLTH
tara:strand:- start:282 stop:560 length:279 start_codon:yes stop_codon:yes gene_type:complete